MADDIVYPLPAFHYIVSIDGEDYGFSEVSGLNIEYEVIEYRDGLSKQYGTMKMPGRPKVGNVTLKKGIMPKDTNFFDWLNKTALNVPDRKDVTISLLNEEHNPAMTWKLAKAWPTKLSLDALKGDGKEIAIESLEIAFEVLTIETAA